MNWLFVIFVLVLILLILLVENSVRSSKSTFHKVDKSIPRDSPRIGVGYTPLITTEEVWVDDVKVRDVETVEWVKDLTSH